MSYTHFYDGLSDKIPARTYENVVLSMARMLKGIAKADRRLEGMLDARVLNPDMSATAEAMAEQAVQTGMFAVTFEGCETLAVKKEKPKFAFCSTNWREPQDRWVVALFAALEEGSDGFYEMSSNGDLPSLKAGFDLFEKVEGRRPKAEARLREELEESLPAGLKEILDGLRTATCREIFPETLTEAMAHADRHGFGLILREDGGAELDVTRVGQGYSVEILFRDESVFNAPLFDRKGEPLSSDRFSEWTDAFRGMWLMHSRTLTTPRP